jgi:hypothetical protein
MDPDLAMRFGLLIPQVVQYEWRSSRRLANGFQRHAISDSVQGSMIQKVSLKAIANPVSSLRGWLGCIFLELKCLFFDQYQASDGKSTDFRYSLNKQRAITLLHKIILNSFPPHPRSSIYPLRHPPAESRLNELESSFP